MTTKLSISVGSISVNGKPVAAISGFSYEGPVEGLGAALEAHGYVREAVTVRASSWQPTRVQAEALHAIAAAGFVVDEGKLGCFAGTVRIKRVTFEVFRQRGLLAEGAGNTFALTPAGKLLEQEVSRG